MRSAVTVSLVPQARGGPFVFWDDLGAACEQAGTLGFDAVEIFAPAADAVTRDELRRLLERYKLQVAAVGTGAGMVIHGWTLTAADAAQREKAVAFIRGMIDFGASFGAPAIIGSMQGRWGGAVDHRRALDLLRQALNTLGEHAASRGVPLIYEPLNRYETNLVNRLADGVALLESLAPDNVCLLADLFHMNIEEANLAGAVRTAGRSIGHVHFVDSNRQAAGRGHLDFAPIISALVETGYNGYLSAEALPLPDSATAARDTIEAFRQHVKPS